MRLAIFNAVSAAWDKFTKGAATVANSVSVALASDHARIKVGTAGEYKAVAASQSDSQLGATGAIGDYLDKIIIVPATTGAGTVSIKDGAGSAINVFVTGTLADLKPHVIHLGLTATGAGWKVTTGANVSIIAVGDFT